ncbi:flavin reductase family protein [Arthrobacter sp. MI7-26]|uniref:flavin reductase family protein n=1 Tax=Arthrobacter sp. MI7-26 TaxID=2993653 RepID=UPI002249957A|nr:flavin reductase family protein [Arthrobacter sp. MI7-26]MCX2749899.1 flavin reductase family protein [Arthrobacter sp. MI7-26]
MSESLAEPHISAEDFRHVFRAHPAGVAVVTADVGDGPVAMTVSSVASLSIHPPTLVFSASAMSSSTPTIKRAETVIVHLLSVDQIDLAKVGARSGVNRFGDDVHWSRLLTGEPYYPSADWLRRRVTQRVEVNGATLIIAEAIEASERHDSAVADPTPLVYHNRRWHALSNRSALGEPGPAFWVVYGRDD